MRKLSKALWVALLLLLPAFAYAQGTLGALTGTVTDPTGALVPEATINITEMKTGVITNTASSSAGYYRVPVPPGTYRLEAKKEGFKTAVAENIVVPVAQVVTIDLTLQVGSVAESVTVTSEAPLLTPSTAEVSNALSPEEFATLPIAVDDGGRQLMTFIFSSLPGTVGDSWSNSINGAQNFTTDIQIDGIAVARYDLQGSISEATPSADAASEFKVSMSSYSAEYGATSGGIANFGMKSGTNGFHGSVYEYVANPVFNATSWNTNHLAEGNIAKVKAPSRENNFGFVVGGPIRKNKTFFFFNYEGDRRTAGSPSSYGTVPTTSMLQGDFSQWLWNQTGSDALGRPIYYYEIYDPTSSRLVADGATDPVTGLVNNSGNSALLRDGFGFDPLTGLPGPDANIIPSSYFSVASAKLVPKFPTPINDQLGNNEVRHSGAPTLDINKWSLKLDHVINDKHKVSGFWTYSARQRIFGSSNYWTPVPDYPINPLKIQQIPFRLLRFSEDWTINDHTLNHFAFGYNRFGNFNGLPSADPAGWLPSDLGITGTPNAKIPSLAFSSRTPPAGHAARPYKNMLTPLGAPQSGMGFNANESYIYSDTLSHVRGKHSFKFGAEYRRYRMNERDTEGMSFTFSYLETGIPAQATRTGHPFASFLLGAADTGSRGIIGTQFGYRQGLFSLYAQDDWKVTSKLTLNYGLRWELPTPQREAFDRLSGLDPTLANPDADNFPGALTFLGNCTGCNGRSSFQNYYYKQFAPRFGFAYSATQKLVVRGGYGISYAPPIVNGWRTGAAGFNSSVGFGNRSLYPRPNGNASQEPAIFWTGLTGQSVPQWYIDHGRVGVPPFTGTLPDLSPGGMNYQGVDLHPSTLAQPYTQNWNFGFQFQLPAEILVEADYVGAKGTRLMSFEWGDQGKINRAADKYMALSAFDTVDDDPIFDLDMDTALATPDVRAELAQFGITGKPFPSFSGTVAQALYPYPQYSGISNTFPNFGSSTYHSLQATVRKRSRHGLNFIAAYTWSKTLTSSDSGIGYYSYYLQDYFNRRAEKSIASFDYTHNFKLTWIYDLPFGKGKKWANSSGTLDRIAGGWRVTAIHDYRVGNPLQIVDGSLASGVDGSWGTRGDVIPGVPQKVAWNGPVDSETGTQYLNPAAFGAPPADPDWGQYATRWGTAPRYLGSTRGPGWQNEDLGILKDTRITERFILKFRADLFNLLNRAGRGDPDNYVDSGTFGMITGVAHGPRNIMLSLRLDF
ncbi:MAG: carboxypeptidase regulatory-like domain-containing protein [Terriglobia bacterium]